MFVYVVFIVFWKLSFFLSVLGLKFFGCWKVKFFDSWVGRFFNKLLVFMVIVGVYKFRRLVRFLLVIFCNFLIWVVKLLKIKIW